VADYNAGLSRNSIERFKSDEDDHGGRHADVVKAKHSELKSAYRDLKQSYYNLEQLTDKLASQSAKPKEFVDPRVRELWGMALKANLSEEDLASFRV
jgi:hypothetical protein